MAFWIVLRPVLVSTYYSSFRVGEGRRRSVKRSNRGLLGHVKAYFDLNILVFVYGGQGRSVEGSNRGLLGRVKA